MATPALMTHVKTCWGTRKFCVLNKTCFPTPTVSKKYQTKLLVWYKMQALKVFIEVHFHPLPWSTVFSHCWLPVWTGSQCGRTTRLLMQGFKRVSSVLRRQWGFVASTEPRFDRNGTFCSFTQFSGTQVSTALKCSRKTWTISIFSPHVYKSVAQCEWCH